MHTKWTGMSGLIFFQYEMKICTAKSKSTHSGTSLLTTCDPWTCLSIEVKRCFFDAKFFIWTFNIYCRRKNFVVQRKSGFDQSCNPSGSFCVAYLRFYAAECDVLKIRISWFFRRIFCKNFF